MLKILILLFITTISYSNELYKKNLYEEGCYDIVNNQISIGATVVESLVLGVKLTMRVSINDPEVRNYNVNLRVVCKNYLNEKAENPDVNIKYSLLRNTIKFILNSNGFKTKDYKRLLQ